MEPSFADTIREHLELKNRNAQLQATMPVERYRSGEAVSNRTLLRAETETRLEETRELGIPAWIAVQEHEQRSTAGDTDADWLWRSAPPLDWDT